MRRLLCALLVVAGCEKAKHADSTKQTEALWALAPEGATLGVVVTPRGTAMIEHAMADLSDFILKAPGLADTLSGLDEHVRQVIATLPLRPADAGFASDKGFAVFMIDPDNFVYVVPIADRGLFLKATGGTRGAEADFFDGATCKTVEDHYVCVTSTGLFDKVGKGTLRKQLDSHGDIEIVADHVPEIPALFSIGIELQRGGLIARGTVTGLTSDIGATHVAPIKPQLDREHSAGFGVLDLEMASHDVTGAVVAGGVTDTALVKTLAGPSYLSIAAGQPAIDVRIPLLDPAPAQTLIDHCAELLGADATATSNNGRCHVAVAPLDLVIDAWIDGNTLRIGMNPPPTATALSPTRGELEMANSAWHVAFWGRGSLLATPVLPPPPAMLANPNVQAVIRAALMINEVGIGLRFEGAKARFVAVLRTAFDNPDDVVAKLATVPIADVLAGKGEQFVHPSGSAPLVDDVKAGFLPLAIPTIIVAAAYMAANAEP